MVELEHCIWTIQALWYVHEERAAVWDFVLTTGSLISKQYQIKKPRTEDILDNLWCAVLVYYTRYVKDLSSGLHPQKSEQVHCFFNTFVALQMAKNTIWINKCPILFLKVHK